MRAIGQMRLGCTIALVSPAATHSSRNTELRTMRAAGLSPKLTLDTPRVVCTCGWAAVMRRIASIVSRASRRVSSWPVPIGNVRQSTMMSASRRPQRPVRSAMSRSATRTFQSAVRAWPSSSIVRATTAAPCSTTTGMTRA